MLKQAEFSVATRGRGTYRIDDQVRRLVADSGILTGLCQVFCQHTSASLILCENADPQVRRDLEVFMTRLAPDGDPLFDHVQEGPDDMPAHVRTVLTQSGILLPVRQGRPALGTWQGLYLWEHRSQGHHRRLILTCWD